MKVSIQSEQPKYDYQFEVADTGIIGVYGISGSGKSSLLNALAGYNDNNNGTIIFNNKPLQGIIKCSYMNQYPVLFPHWSINQNLEFALQHCSQGQNELNNLIKTLQCEHLLNLFPRQLSGGERQRIAFIRSLIMIENNSLLLLDEPFSALHPKLRKVALSLLKNYKKHCLIFMVTHDISEIYQYTDELLLLENGQINFQDTIQSAMTSKHPYLPLASKINLSGENFVIYANDVSVNLSRNIESSISYQLDIVIDEIVMDNNQAVLKLQLTSEPHNQFLFAKLTIDSIKRLGLTVNQKAVACFKSLAFERR